MGRIEICSGSYGSGTFGGFQNDLSTLIRDKERVIGSFKAVRTQIRSVSGGVGNLQSSLNQLDARIKKEETNKAEAEKIEKKAEEFFELANRVDKQVAQTINKNKNEFFKKFPHLKPADPPEDKAWYEEAWDWLCGKGEEFVESIKAGWDWIKDTVKKGWDNLVAFYQEHKKIIDTVLIVVGAIVAIASVVIAGPYALLAVLTAIGFSASTAATISAVVFVTALVSTGLAALVNIADVWLEIDNPVFNVLQGGLNVISGLTTALIDIGGLYNSFHGVTPMELKNFKAQNYTRAEIQNAVKQDRQILKFNRAIKKSKNPNLTKGNYGEMRQDQYMRQQGYKRINENMVLEYSSSTHQGLDGVYYNGNRYVIGEAKYNTAQLNVCSDGTKQMSAKWIEDRLLDEFGPELASEILNSDYISQVYRVFPNKKAGIVHLDDWAEITAKFTT